MSEDLGLLILCSCSSSSSCSILTSLSVPQPPADLHWAGSKKMSCLADQISVPVRFLAVSKWDPALAAIGVYVLFYSFGNHIPICFIVSNFHSFIQIFSELITCKVLEIELSALQKSLPLWIFKTGIVGIFLWIYFLFLQIGYKFFEGRGKFQIPGSC